MKKDGFGHEKPVEGETNDWITPKWVIETFDNYAWKTKKDGCFFDLDPCISPTQPWLTARKGYSIEQNGLVQAWWGKTYCNPPYGKNVGAWAQKMAEHGNGIMLIFARLETRVWQNIIFPSGDAFLFPDKRINFCEFLCECGRPRSWHNGSSKKKTGRACNNFRNTGIAVEAENAGAPSAFIAWGDECKKALVKLSVNNQVRGTVFGQPLNCKRENTVFSLQSICNE